MNQCQHCQGFVPLKLQSCPHCDLCLSDRSQKLKWATHVALGIGLSLSLNSCRDNLQVPAYGIAPANPINVCDKSDPKPGQSCPDFSASNS